MILGIIAPFTTDVKGSNQKKYTATQGQTVFILETLAESVDVSINNTVLVLDIDYTHIVGTNIVTLINQANENDIITIRSHQ